MRIPQELAYRFWWLAFFLHLRIPQPKLVFNRIDAWLCGGKLIGVYQR